MSTRLSVLVVEDHDLLRDATVAALNDAGHFATGVISAEEVDDAPTQQPPDLYVIDLNLPGEDGLQLAKRIRKSHPRAGIVMVTARTNIRDRVSGYESGADIYLPKPVDPEELLAAVEALSHRIRPLEEDATLVLDLKSLQLRGPAAAVGLSQSEANLLSAFAKASGAQLERFQVSANLSITGETLNATSLEVRLSRLRKKLNQVGADEPTIKAIRGLGYKLCSTIRFI
jgi:DNA-binding response OmpR family regulator